MNGITTQSLGRGEGTTKAAKSTKKETKVVGVRFVTPKLENRINRVPQSSSTV
jgi:hypothetical protein